MHGKLVTLVEHRSGCKVGNVDVLSRHFGTVIKGGNSDKENVPHERAKKPLVLNRHREHIVINETFSQIATMFSTGEKQI